MVVIGDLRSGTAIHLLPQYIVFCHNTIVWNPLELGADCAIVASPHARRHFVQQFPSLGGRGYDGDFVFLRPANFSMAGQRDPLNLLTNC